MTLSDSTQNSFRTLLKLAGPVVVSQVGHMLFGFADTLMVGRVGADYLAAASVANSVFVLIMVVGLGLTFAISPLTAEKLGAGRRDLVPGMLTNGLWVVIPFSLILWVLTWLIAENFDLLQLNPVLTQLGRDYLKIVGISIIPLMIFQVYRQYIDGLGNTRPSMVITWIGLVFNIILNYALIYGHWGFPELKLEGAAWATLVSRIIMLILIWITLHQVKSLAAFKPIIEHYRFSAGSAKKLLRVGLPSGFQYVFEVAAFSGASVLIGWIGTKDLAAHQVAINLASLTYMAATGFSAAGSIRAGFFYGEKNPAMIRETGTHVLLMTAALMSVFALLFIIFRNWLPWVYTSDQTVLAVASDLLLIAAFFQISDGVQAVGLGLLRGIQDTRIPTLITFVAYWIFGLPVGWWLGFTLGWGAVGIWTGLSVGLTVSAGLLTIRFFKISGLKSRFLTDSNQ
ncbi:MAG: MATE family efflux transporter [Bacteroidetes bacterium]|nr:MATE family efflux transporter [Bacteroidota bacterium]